MKMPVVLLTHMAMNESIAASCCYTRMVVGTIDGPADERPYVSTYRTLNGGSILFDYRSPMEYRASTNYPQNIIWLSIPGDVMPTLTDVNSGYSPVQTSSGWSVVYGGMPYTLKPDDLLQAQCNHQNRATCRYYDIAQTVLDIAHVGATTAHAYGVKGEKNWATPHMATEYLS